MLNLVFDIFRKYLKSHSARNTSKIQPETPFSKCLCFEKLLLWRTKKTGSLKYHTKILHIFVNVFLLQWKVPSRSMSKIPSKIPSNQPLNLFEKFCSVRHSISLKIDLIQNYQLLKSKNAQSLKSNHTDTEIQ